jgi:hypothetical protein
VLHLLNYASKPAANIRVKLTLGSEFARLQGHNPTLASPDHGVSSLRNVSWNGKNLEFTLPSLNTYAVVYLKE